MRARSFFFHLLFLTMAACGGGDDASDGPPAAPAASNAPAAPDAPSQKRTMTTEAAMGTRPDNLVVDPTFGSLGSMYGAVVFASDMQADVEHPTRSPAGAAQPVVRVTATGAQPTFILAAQGGTGPFEAHVWIATEPGEKDPSVSLATIDGDGVALSPAAGSDQKFGDRTYRLFSAKTTTPLYGKIYFLVEPAGKKAITIAKPELLLQQGMTTKSFTAAAARVRLGEAQTRMLRALAEKPIVVPGPSRLRTAPPR